MTIKWEQVSPQFTPEGAIEFLNNKGELLVDWLKKEGYKNFREIDSFRSETCPVAQYLQFATGQLIRVWAEHYFVVSVSDRGIKLPENIQKAILQNDRESNRFLNA